MINAFKSLTRAQRNAFLAAFSGWSLDAFDFFIFIFSLKAIGTEFHADVAAVAEGIFLTLALRPVGALVFGWLAERYGRRPVLIANVLSFSLVEIASAFAPNLATLLALRALFGFAMGGEWGVGAALAFETLPARGRGFFSGLLQEGYAVGYLLASIAFATLFTHIGWRGMFLIGGAPALLALFVSVAVEESPSWSRAPRARALSLGETFRSLRPHLALLLFLVALMAAFNAFSHGSQDLYPTFLLAQRHFSAGSTGLIAVVMNLGALVGGMSFGALSERIGRKRAIALAAALALPVIPLWVYSHAAVGLAIGGFLMQFMVQGAWGVVPAHLNELSPPAVRAILPGFAYQLGNLAMSKMGPIQAGLAEAHHGDYAGVLAWTMGIVAIAMIVLASFGPEARAAPL